MTGVDYTALKAGQQGGWAAGDYGNIGSRMQIVSEKLCDTVDLRSHERVLDVACGHGNTALAAARRFCPTVGVDYVPALLEQGRRRAAAEGLPVTFTDGDAEALPFPDASFDVVLSTYGVMFAPDQPRAAAELLRVCVREGRIGLSSWTPDSAAGAMFRAIGKHVPPPGGVMPPTSWGTEERLRILFGPTVTIQSAPRTLRTCFPSVEYWLDHITAHLGPVVKAMEKLDSAGRAALRADLAAAVTAHNVSGDDTLVLAQNYLESIIYKNNA